MPAVPSQVVTIESLDQEGRGVARVDGKATFVEGALPGERVRIAITRRKPTFDLATVQAIERPSASRVEPRCPHFGTCGGCSLQHFDPAAQVAAKQRVLEDALRHIAKLAPDCLLAPIHGPAWAYRHRARLGVRDVARKGGVLVGFHERRSSYIADMRECAILPANVSALLVPLRALVESLSIRMRLPQIEVAVGDEVTVLVFRHLLPLTDEDTKKLRAFADVHGVHVWLQPGGPDTAHPLHPTASALTYALPDFDVSFAFLPTEFTQVNAAINRVLVRRAVSLLAPRPGERIADLFCGLGNFTLPIARSGATVLGVEGSETLVERATQNARRNGLEDRASFRVADLFAATPESIAALGDCDRMLIDPPREGALAVVRSLAPTGTGARAVGRIVYVSCNPSTLARDAAVLVHEKGYALRAAGAVNMFPHTAHVESIAVFDPERAVADGQVEEPV